MSDIAAPATVFSNKKRAYRRLILRIQPQSWVDKPNGREIEMADNIRGIPICKLKVGEYVTQHAKRQHTIADLNNFRSNYRNYSHYRAADADESNFPPIKSGRTSRNSGRESQNSMDFVVKHSARSCSRNTYVDATHNGSPTTPMHMVIGRRKMCGERSVSIPSSHLSPKDDLHGYELRGSPVFKSTDTQAKPNVRSMSSTFHRTGSQTERPGRQKPGRNPRPGVFLYTATYPKSGFRHGMTPTVTEITAPEGMASYASRPGRNCQYDDIKVANIQNYVLPVTEKKLRLGRMQAGYQLTRKNLEMFEYYTHPDADPEKPTPTPVIEKDPDLDKRVYQWVKERQIRTYRDQPLSDITTDENDESEKKVNDKDSINGKLSTENHLLHGDSPVDDDTPSPDNDISTPDIAKKAKNTRKVNIVINGVHGSHTNNVGADYSESSTHNENRSHVVSFQDDPHNNITR